MPVDRSLDPLEAAHQPEEMPGKLVEPGAAPILKATASRSTSATTTCSAAAR